MNKDEFLYNTFISMLFILDGKHHSCLNDLVFLKDYKKIMAIKLEDENNDGMKGEYSGIYRHQVNAEKMRRYLEENVMEYYNINKWELFVRLKNGDRFIYDNFYNVVKFDSYSDELTDEQEARELANNLKKIMDRKFISQERLAKEVGVDRITINRYINGKRIPDAVVLRKIAKVLDCSVVDFYYRHY